jgi:hypothetical protein
MGRGRNPLEHIMPNSPPKKIPPRRERQRADIVDGPQHEPSSIPRRMQAEAKRLVPGRKRRRGHEGGRSIQAKDIPGKTFLSFDGSTAVIDHRPEIRQKPLTRAAIKLLEAYMARETFWWAIHAMLFPVEWSGRTYLRVGKTRAFEVLRELEEFDSPHAWFRGRALLGMSEGEIGRGRETQGSPLADSFFVALAGGQSEIGTLRCQVSSQRSVDVREIHRGQSEIEREITDYAVYSRLIWRGA